MTQPAKSEGATKKMRTCPTWHEEAMYRRLERCRLMLHLHGLLSEAENATVRRRISKFIERGHDLEPEPAVQGKASEER